MNNEQAISGRKTDFLCAASQHIPNWYDESGNWIAPSTPALARERLWSCFALYANGSDALADAVIAQTQFAATPRDFSIFDPNIACALLVQHRDKMDRAAREKLEALLRTAFGFYPGNRQPDFQFQGFNDNMPAKATMGLVLGGELLDEPDAVEYGLWNLRQLRALLVRNGINSEWNSPTYTPLTIHAMSEIASHARSEEARDLARGIEERLWLDLAARFHPNLKILCGPYGRAYTPDNLAHLSIAATLLWFQLGDAAQPSPMLLVAGQETLQASGLVLHHMGDVPFNIVQMCWLAASVYHLPEAAWRMFANRQYPFHAAASFETGDSGTDWPARGGGIQTWQQPDYALGTATTPCGGGEQTMTYFATYRRKAEVKSHLDVGTVFSKILINGDVPGEISTSDRQPLTIDTPAATYRDEEDLLTSYANTLAIQNDDTALVLTHPHLALGGSIDETPERTREATPITDISELIICSVHSGGAEEIWVGGQPRATWQGEVPRGEWIVCRRGKLLIGLRPLVYGCGLSQVPITLEKVNNYEVVRSCFYHGELRTFTRRELRHYFGGFVAEHASVSEYESVGAFAAELEKTKFTDYYWVTRRMRYRRPQSSHRAALDMEVARSSGTQAPRYATINSRPMPQPILEINGVSAEEIPFLNEPFQAIPPFFPWKDFENVWYDLPYAIGDREE